MPSALLTALLAEIHERGPLTFAAFMELALYHPTLGYYTRQPRRTGRAGDFFTSVDVGPLFGRALATQIADCWRVMDRPQPLDVVEAAAGDGRLLCDVLDALAANAADCYAAVRAHTVEISSAARTAQETVLSKHRRVLASSSLSLPSNIHGVVYANELLDAMPTHAVTMTLEGLREFFVTEENGRLMHRLAEPSTPRLSEALSQAELNPSPGWRGEVSLAAEAWMTRLATTLGRGFAILVDYGHEAHELADPRHSGGTLMAFEGHRASDGLAACLESPGDRDITAHVNFTAVTRAAEREGLRTLARMDQTYFLLGVGAADWLTEASGDPVVDLRRRLALKTLLVPGGLGSTMKVLIFGKGVGDPPLRATSWGGRLT